MAQSKAKQEEEEKYEPLKYIDFNWNGTTYTLEFNRRTAEYVERDLGINVAEMLTSRKINFTDLPLLFRAALMMHHPRMKVEVADDLYDRMTDKQNLGFAIIELLAYTVNSVFEEPEEGKGISWTRH